MDPVVADYADPQSYNGYSYARNNPVNLTDPTGMLVAPYGFCTSIEIPGIGPAMIESATPGMDGSGLFSGAAPASPGGMPIGGFGLSGVPGVSVISGVSGAPVFAGAPAATAPTISPQGQQGPQLTDLERSGIAKLDEFAARNEANGDQFERGFAYKDGRFREFIGTAENPQGDVKHVDIKFGPGHPLIGHTHTVGGEGISVGDRIGFSLGNTGAPRGNQMIVRTPTSAIRSLTTIEGGLRPETLRGPPIQGFPLRE